MLAALVVSVIDPVWALALVWSRAVEARRIRDRTSRAMLLRATAVGLATIVGVIAAPVAARGIAEARSGWIDADRNGFLDPFAGGGTDWFDIHFDAFALWWAVGVAIVTVWLAAGSRWLSGADRARSVRAWRPIRPETTGHTDLGSTSDR